MKRGRNTIQVGEDQDDLERERSKSEKRCLRSVRERKDHLG